MPTAARRKAEARKRRGLAWDVLSVGLMALIPTIVPRTPTFIVVALVAVFLCGIKAAQYGYVDRPSKGILATILFGHVAALVLLGWWIWPRVVVSPSHISFRGYPDETFNFSVRNGRADDVYDVQIPFLIGYDKHFENKLAAKVIPNSDPAQRIYDDYNYCFGVKGDGIISHIQKNEQEVLIVRIPHMGPYGSGSFSVTYAGGDKFDTKPGTPNFVGEPYSYSPSEGTVGVRGDYRICKFVVSTNGLTGK
ncbi:MAG: hypothetical protein WB421_17015 [Terriglobales bacterium]